jgi:hypothetical protein
MLAGMSAAQLGEWLEFEREEPFGFPAEANLVALLSAVVANSAPFRTGEPISPEKFVWRPGRKAAASDSNPADVMGAEQSGPDLSRPIQGD